MGYKELKELVIRKLKKDPNFLDEQIEIMDENNAIIQACGLQFPKGEEKTPECLDMLIKIREELSSLPSKDKTNG